MAWDNTPLLLIALHPKCKLFEIERGLPEYLETPLRGQCSSFRSCARARAHTHTHTQTRLRGCTPARNVPCVNPEDRAKSKEILWFAQTMRKVYLTSRSTLHNSGSVDCRFLRVCHNQRCRNIWKYLVNLIKYSIYFIWIVFTKMWRRINIRSPLEVIWRQLWILLWSVFFVYDFKMKKYLTPNSLSFIPFFLTSSIASRANEND